MSTDDLLGLSEAALIAGVKPGALRRACRIGRLPARRIGARSYAVTRADLAEYMAWTSQRLWLVKGSAPLR